MKEAIANAPMELKGFYAMLAGSATHLLGFLSSASLMQVMGLLVAVAGLIVQVSAYLRNRAETRRVEAEMRIKEVAEQREQEIHEARMHFMRRDLERLSEDLKLKVPDRE